MMNDNDANIEINILHSRIGILQQEISILNQEKLLLQNNCNNNSTINNDDTIAEYLKKILDLKGIVTTLSQKLLSLSSLLRIEKHSLISIKNEYKNTINAINIDIIANINTIKNFFNDIINGKVNEITQLKNTISSSNSMREEHNKEMETIRVKLKTMEDCHKQEINNIQKMFYSDNEILHNDINNLINDNNKLKEQLNEASNSNNHLNKKVELLLLRNEDDQNKILELSQKLITDKDNYNDQCDVIKKLKNEISNKENSINELNNDNNRYKDTEIIINSLNSQRDDLIDKNNRLNDQQSQLLALYDKLNSDLNAVLRREQFLRAEMGTETNDKSELQRRLRSITEKVNALEKEHSEEIKRLIADKDDASHSKEKLIMVNKELEFRLKEKDNMIESRGRGIAAIKEQLSSAAATVGKLNNKMLDYKNEISSSTTTCEQLRQDRDDISEKYNNILIQKGNEDASIATLNIEKNELKREKDNIEMNMKKMRQERDDEILHLKEEILNLKDCVRRECEERTAMIIEMSELRDEVANLNHLKKSGKDFNGGTNSNAPFLKTLINSNNNNEDDNESLSSIAWMNKKKVKSSKRKV